MEINIDNMVIPDHIAIILDGNGRWAKKRGLPRSMGHKEGCVVKTGRGRKKRLER